MAARRITVTLPEDVYDALTAEAEESQRKLSDLVRDAVTQLLSGDRWRSIGDVAEEYIREGLTNAEVLEAVRERFPEARTSMQSVAFYRSRLRKAGENVMSDAEARRDRIT
ncbi:MAG: ribbon-helix-helix protein, CopG family [Pseudomonadota bacterium]